MKVIEGPFKQYLGKDMWEEVKSMDNSFILFGCIAFCLTLVALMSLVGLLVFNVTLYFLEGRS